MVEPQISLEHLYHFQCGSCSMWWSIGDAPVKEKPHFFCPHCGIKNEIKETNNES